MRASWKALNPPDFSYGDGAESMLENRTCTLIDHPEPGFLNRYSTASIEEDMAEVFANFVTGDEDAEEIIKRDQVVKNKLGLILQVMKRAAILR
jgi:hypothetical protein